jgi:glycosyltransferase involved in cell wall biosynthesis/SAM-dependent methyltransferase
VTDAYDNQFADDNVYGHIVDLLGRFHPPAGALFLDFGCGYGRIAEVLRDRFGLSYIGFDVTERALSSLRERGFEAAVVDLRCPAAELETRIRAQVHGRPIAALGIIDTLEHVEDPVQVLRALHGLGRAHSVPLLVSVPNIAHRDVGLKLAVGRFDATPAGLLDHTHLQWFTAARMTAVLHASGWHEVHEKDVLLPESDQHFPSEHPILSRGAPLHRFLADLRAGVDHFDTVNQFVRAYLPGPVPREEPVVGGDVDTGAPFLTVVTRTQGTRTAMLREALLCLSAQTCQDFEVCVVGHDLTVERQLDVERLIADLHDDIRDRVRLIRVSGGTRGTPLNAGFADARGRYIVALDDDDLVLGHWVASFLDLARTHPGQVLRMVAIAQDWDVVTTPDAGKASRATGGMRAIYAEEFDFLAHIVENRSPLHSIAFPRSLFHDLGCRFDETLTTSEDWDLILRAVPLAGVAATSSVGCIYRHWKNSDTSDRTHTELEWRANYFQTLRKLDKLPLLLPPGSVSRLRDMAVDAERRRDHHQSAHGEIDAAGDPELEMLRERCHALLQSHSWRMTAPLRALVRRVRRAGREVPPRVWRMSGNELADMIDNIERSTSWRITRPLRERRRRALL